MKPVKHIETKKGMTVDELIREMDKSGVFGAGRLSKAVAIAEKMIADPECKVFFGLAGAMVPGGMRQIIIDMLENGWIDIFVTTGANLTHDLVEAMGYNHYQGSAHADDKKLHEEGIDRIYESYMPNEVYEKLEQFCSDVFDMMMEKNPNLRESGSFNIKEFLWLFGSYAPKGSILRTCADKKIPIFCPALADSGIGLQVWNYIQRSKLPVDAFDDLKEILDIAWTSKHAGVFYIGGGVPKNYIQQAMQFSKSALYGIQITTDRPESGGSSGAELRESISWGKLSAEAEFVDVICDATIALPIIHAALKERLEVI
jgi:deoxyhypusine synthase